MLQKMKELLRKIYCKVNWVYSNDVHYINGADTLPPPLAPDEEQRLLQHYDGTQLPVRQILIEHNLRLVVYIARKFDNTGIGLEDLISIGTIGLIKAVNTYRNDKNTKLATYASRCIENEILMYLRKSVNQRTEVSIDEPLNTDWDGNELLCPMCWEQSPTASCARWRMMWKNKFSSPCCVVCPSGIKPSFLCVSACLGKMK